MSRSIPLLPALISLGFVSVADVANAQRADIPPGPQRRTQVSGAVTATNKGISLIPALTLGKPAAIFDVAITNGALGFEPQFRFGLDGKPWTFIFWGRYRPLRDGKFRLTIGAHPALTFKTITAPTPAPHSAIVTRRYFATDLYPSYFIAKNLSVGPYYLFSRGLDSESFQHTHFAGARANLTSLPIAGRLFIQFAPQLYYLWMDGAEGTYVSATLTLAHRSVPFSIATLMNSPMHSGIAGGQDFLWNVSLVYSMR